MRTLAWVFLGSALATLSGCGNGLASSSSPASAVPGVAACTGGSAEIGVGDGFLENLCGCAEAAGVPQVAPAVLKCTVKSGTVMLFHFIGIKLSHQVVSVGTPSFPASPVVGGPANVITTQPFAADFAVPGTYSFQDAFNAAMAGQIIVTP